MDRSISVILVFIGGGLGSVLRYLLSIALPTTVGGFPWATLIVNAVASFIIGMVTGSKWIELHESYRLLLAVGICGGLSTFSTFALEGHRMIGSHFFTMILYYLLSCVLCLILVRVGMKIM